MPIDSAIFAEQKSNQCGGAIAPTTSRPLRGVQSLEQGGATASATIALEADTARLSPRLPCRRLASKAQQKQRRFILFGALASGEGITPPFAKKQSNTQNLENIRENASLRNLETTESSVDSESKAENLGSTESKTLTESGPTDSKENLDSKIHYFRFKKM